MANLTLYTTSICPYCVRAKNLFGKLGLPFDEVNLEGKPELRHELSERYKWRTVPMIVAGDRFLGGYDDVSELHAKGELLPLLAQKGIVPA